MELLLLPLVPFVLVPPLAWVPAAGFAWAARRRPRMRGRAWVRGVAALWFLYGLYECAMFVWAHRVLAPIRIDLLVLAPLLGGLTLVALWLLRRAGRRP